MHKELFQKKKPAGALGQVVFNQGSLVAPLGDPRKLTRATSARFIKGN